MTSRRGLGSGPWSRWKGTGTSVLLVALLGLAGLAVATLDGAGLAGAAGPAFLGLAGLAATGDGDPIGELVEKIARAERGEDGVTFDTDADDDFGRLYDAVGSLAAGATAEREANRYRRELYDVAADPDLDSDETIGRLLELGCERLDVANGHVVAVDPEADRHEIEQAYGSDLVEAGDVAELSESFCRETVTAEEVVALSNVAESRFADDPASERWGFDTYVGARVDLDGELYGTVCFVDDDPRETDFSPEQTEFVSLVARWVSQELDRRARTTQLHLRQRALEAAPVGVTISDATQADNPIVYVNDQFEAKTGYDSEEILGRNCRFLQGEGTDADSVRELREAIAAAEPTTTELRNYRRDGTEFWNRVSVAPVENGAGEVTNFVGFQEDVTERRERAAELERKATLLDALFEQLPVNIYAKDEAGRHVRTSTPYLRDEYPDDEEWFEGKTDLDIYPEQFAEETHADDMAVIEDGEPVIKKVEYNEGDAEWILTSKVPWRGEDGAVRGLLGFSQDITEQKQREQELQETKRNLELVLEGTKTGMWEWDLNTDEVDWNDTFEAMLGLDPGGFEGTYDAFERRIHPADRDHVETAVRKAIDSEDELYQAEFRLEHEDGTWVWVTARGRVVYGEDGHRRLIGINHDISERKEYEQQLRAERDRFATLFDSLPNPVYHAEARDGKPVVRDVNSAFEETFGVSREEIRGDHLHEHVELPDAEAEQLPEHNREVLEADQFRTEGRRETVDGMRTFQLDIAVGDDDPGPPEGYTIYTDITDRKEYERELERTTDLLTRAEEMANMGGWSTDVRGDTPEHVEWTDKMYDIFELDPDQRPPPEEVSELYHPEDRERHQKEVERALEAGESWNQELRVLTDEGDQRWVQSIAEPVVEDGETVELRGAVQDVTGRKEREQELRATRDRFAEHNRTLRRLYEISADQAASFDEKMQQLLDLGRERLGTDGAFLSRIDRDDDAFEFVHASGSMEAIRAGTTAPFSETYCRKLVEQGGIFDVVDAGAEGWSGDPAYDRWHLDTYFGASVYVTGELEGTLAFVDGDPHDGALTDDQRTFVELATQWVSYELERRRRERELTEHKQFTEDVLDSLDDVFYVLDEDGSLTRWNDSLPELTGYSDEEIRSMHALDFFAEEDQETVADAIAAVYESGRSRVEAPYLTKAGEKVPHEFVASSLDDPEGNRVLAGAGRDVTERKQRNEELREREAELERYREYTENVLDAIDDVFYIVDRDGELQRWNETLNEFTGYTDAELAEMNARDFFGDEDARKIKGAIDNIENLVGVPLEVQFQTKAGEEVPYEFVAAPLTTLDGTEVVAGIARDISSRKEKERELSRLVSNVPGFVYRVRNEPGWPTEFASDGVRDITGYEPGQIERGEVTWEDMYADDSDWIAEEVEGALDRGEPFSLAYPIETADGERRWVKEDGRGVYADDGTVDVIEGVVIDITERKQYEQELERTTDMLEQAGRIAQVGGWELDPATDPPEMTWTDELYDIHELEPGTHVDVETAIGLYHPKDRDYVQDQFENAMQTGEGYDMEVRLQSTGGRQRWVRALGEAVSEDGEVVKLRGSVQDITEQKERQKELERTQDLLTQAQRVARIGGWELDVTTEPNELTFTDELYDIHGLSRDADLSLGESIEFYHPEARPRIRHAIETAIERGTSYDVEGRFRTANGETLWVRAIGKAVQEDGETVKVWGSLQDITEVKERELALQSLHDATRGLLQTETESEVAELVVETAASLFDVPGVAVYAIDDASNQLAPLAYTDAFEVLSDGSPAVGVGDDAVLWNCFATGERLVFDDAEDARESRVFGDRVDSGLVVPMGDHGVFVVATEGAGIDDDTRRLAETLVATTEAAFDRLASEANLRQRDAELEAQNQRLRRQVGINDIIRRVDQSLVGATSREGVESAVCDRLVESDDVAFAWIGGFDGDGGQLVPRTWAGTGESYLDSLALEGLEGAAEPSLATANSGEATVVSNVVDGLREDGWRRDALASGFHSVISVPLAVDEHAHGVLTVYAEEPDVFDDLERTVFAELGQSIANAINAVSAREALHADTVVELTLQLDEPNGILARVARDADCEVVYEGISTRSGDETQLFFATTGASADTVETILADLYAVTEYRLVSENDDGRCLFEATATGTVLPSALVDQGASPRSIRATPSGTEAVVDLPTSTDVREFVELLVEAFPSVELRSRRNVERGMGTRQQLLSSLLAELTDRQLEVLRTAYFAGFFEWPRASTGEDVAEMLGVTQPTVNRHLRLGQQRLLAELFDEEAPDLVSASD